MGSLCIYRHYYICTYEPDMDNKTKYSIKNNDYIEVDKMKRYASQAAYLLEPCWEYGNVTHRII